MILIREWAGEKYHPTDRLRYIKMVQAKTRRGKNVFLFFSHYFFDFKMRSFQIMSLVAFVCSSMTLDHKQCIHSREKGRERDKARENPLPKKKCETILLSLMLVHLLLITNSLYFRSFSFMWSHQHNKTPNTPTTSRNTLLSLLRHSCVLDRSKK